MNSANNSTRGGRFDNGKEVNSFEYISFKKDDDGNLPSNLFCDFAQQAAKDIAGNGNKFTGNKPTQLRRFFDEIIMWNEKLNQCDDKEKKFNEYLPFIRMLNAKAAYAKGRKLINDDFVTLLSHCINQVKTADDFYILKLFFEAFMGFYKLEKN